MICSRVDSLPQCCLLVTPKISSVPHQGALFWPGTHPSSLSAFISPSSRSASLPGPWRPLRDPFRSPHFWGCINSPQFWHLPKRPTAAPKISLLPQGQPTVSIEARCGVGDGGMTQAQPGDLLVAGIFCPPLPFPALLSCDPCIKATAWAVTGWSLSSAPLSLPCTALSSCFYSLPGQSKSELLLALQPFIGPSLALIG